MGPWNSQSRHASCAILLLLLYTIWFHAASALPSPHASILTVRGGDAAGKHPNVNNNGASNFTIPGNTTNSTLGAPVSSFRDLVSSAGIFYLRRMTEEAYRFAREISITSSSPPSSSSSSSLSYRYGFQINILQLEYADESGRNSRVVSGSDYNEFKWALFQPAPVPAASVRPSFKLTYIGLDLDEALYLVDRAGGSSSDFEKAVIRALASRTEAVRFGMNPDEVIYEFIPRRTGGRRYWVGCSTEKVHSEAAVETG